MDLNQLRTLTMVAELHNLSRAAEALNLSQPAVTYQMQALENELGVRLLERQPRRVLLTGEGEILCDYARRILNMEREARQTLAEMKGLQKGCVRLGASPTIGAYLLPTMLGQFHARYPRLRVIAEIEPSYRVAEDLASRSIDVGLVEAAVDTEGIAADVFRDDELVLAVRAGHPWAACQSVQPGELRGASLISREPRSGTRALVEERLRAIGIEVTPALELGSVEAIKNAVLAGLGVAFISRHAIEAEERLGLLAAVPVAGLSLRRPFYCLRHKDHLPSPALEAFLGFVFHPVTDEPAGPAR